MLELDGITIEVVRARVKYIRLTVHRTGRVRISAPTRVPLPTIQDFAASKLDWIKRHLEKRAAQAHVAPKEFVSGETHYAWGEPRVLEVIEVNAAPGIDAEGGLLVLRVRPGADTRRRQSVVTAWYRDQVRIALPPLIEVWGPRLAVRVTGFSVRQMKSRWGSCNTRSGAIRLNSELAKKPRVCLEYVAVHEMLHLLEPSHNHRFKALLDRFMPAWRMHRSQLNAVQ